MAVELSVESLCQGGIVERIHEELRRVIENVNDPNTDAKKTRKVKMEIIVKPKESRQMAEVSVATSSTLVAPRPIETAIRIGFNPLTGELGASEILPTENPLQHTFPDTMNKGKLAAIGTKPDSTSSALQ